MLLEKNNLTSDRLQDLLIYDPKTGIFRWRIDRPVVKAGDIAGSIHQPSGYSVITVDKYSYQSSRLAWLYMYGEFPPSGMQIDHVDGNRINNSISNLRLATVAQNSYNRKLKRTNKHGCKGVTFRRNKWDAYIGVARRRKFLGTFRTKEEAANAYAEAAKIYHGEFVRQVA